MIIILAKKVFFIVASGLILQFFSINAAARVIGQPISEADKKVVQFDDSNVFYFGETVAIKQAGGAIVYGRHENVCKVKWGSGDGQDYWVLTKDIKYLGSTVFEEKFNKTKAKFVFTASLQTTDQDFFDKGETIYDTTRFYIEEPSYVFVFKVPNKADIYALGKIHKNLNFYILTQKVPTPDYRSIEAKNIGKIPSVSTPFTSLETFAQACTEKKEHASLGAKDISAPVVEWPELLNTVQDFANQHRARGFFTSTNWLNGNAPDEAIFEKFPASKVPEPSILFVQKFIIPKHPANVCFIGDIHGSVHSLLRNLLTLKKLDKINDNFTIKDENFYMVFNGDFVDRGKYGAEIWYMLLKLKLANWDKVFLLRGNHETFSISNNPNFSSGGFSSELVMKYGSRLAAFPIIASLYELLPVALYLGTAKLSDKNIYLQCCHGGIEVAYIPKKLLATESIRYELIEVDELLNNAAKQASLHPKLINPKEKYIHKSGCQTGFNWSDFFQNTPGDHGQVVPGERVYGYDADVKATNAYLKAINSDEKNIVVGFMRGHQDMGFGLKLFLGDEEADGKSIGREARTFSARGEEYARGPWGWKAVKQEFDQINPFGFRMYVPDLIDHAPIFTFTTAAEGQAVNYDCFGMVTTDREYVNWRLKLYEFGLPLDRDFKRAMTQATTFDAWEKFIEQNIEKTATSDANKNRYFTTLEIKEKELAEKKDPSSVKMLAYVRSEKAYFAPQIKSGSSEAPKTAPHDPLKPITLALTMLQSRLSELAKQLARTKTTP